MYAYGGTWLRMTHFSSFSGASSLDAVTLPGVINPATGAFRQPAWCSRAVRVFPQFDDVASTLECRLAFKLAPYFMLIKVAASTS
jgi:hypothetical protein